MLTIPQLKYDNNAMIDLGPFFEAPYNNGINLSRLFPVCSVTETAKIDSLIRSEVNYEEIKNLLTPEQSDETKPPTVITDPEIFAFMLRDEMEKVLRDKTFNDSNQTAVNLWVFFSEYMMRITNNFIDMAFKATSNTKDKLIDVLGQYLADFDGDAINVFREDLILQLTTCKRYEPSTYNIFLSINKFPISFAYDYLACYLSLHYAILYMRTRYYDAWGMNVSTMIQYFYSKLIENYNGLIRETQISEKNTPTHISNYYLNHHQLGPQSQLLQEIIAFLANNDL